MAALEELLLAHDANYVQRVIEGKLSPSEQREIGFPWSEEMVQRSRRSVGATIAAGRTACKEGAAVNLAGGTHHAFSDRGSGFCVFNDVAVAARVLQRDGLALCPMVIDLDVHQGNGTARIFAEDRSVFTVSLHAAKNFPFRKESSDLDVALADDTGDGAYLDALSATLERCSKVVEADFIFFLAGADPHEGDRLGRLKLTHDGLMRRDEMVLDFACSRGLPIAIVMAGGYGRNIDDTVQAHFNTVCLAADRFAREQANALSGCGQ